MDQDEGKTKRSGFQNRLYRAELGRTAIGDPVVKIIPTNPEGAYFTSGTSPPTSTRSPPNRIPVELSAVFKNRGGCRPCPLCPLNQNNPPRGVHARPLTSNIPPASNGRGGVI